MHSFSFYFLVFFFFFYFFFTFYVFFFILYYSYLFYYKKFKVIWNKYQIILVNCQKLSNEFEEFLRHQGFLFSIFLLKHPQLKKYGYNSFVNFFINLDFYDFDKSQKYSFYSYKKVGDEIFFIKWINRVFGNDFFMFILMFIY